MRYQLVTAAFIISAILLVYLLLPSGSDSSQEYKPTATIPDVKNENTVDPLPLQLRNNNRDSVMQDGVVQRSNQQNQNQNQNNGMQNRGNEENRRNNINPNRPRNRPKHDEKMVEYEEEEFIDNDGLLIKNMIFKVNDREKISLLSADPTPIDWKKPFVVLLHDAPSSAQVWDQIGTMQALVSVGYRVRALNLPGRGDTTIFQKDGNNRGLWLQEVMDDFSLYPFILVMASTGSGYGVPFINSLIEENLQHAMVGMVAIGPSLMPPLLKISPIPSLLMYGDRDPLFLRDAERIQPIEHVTVIPIAKAGHQCWIDRPEAFNLALVDWILNVNNE